LLLAAAISTVFASGMAARYGRSWPRRLYWPRPKGIVLHHSASPGYSHGRQIDASVIDRWHGERGWGQETISSRRHIGYHYVILPDGTVETGRPEWMLGAHCSGHNDQLGICLVGNFSSAANPDGRIRPSRPTDEQMQSLRALLTDLLNKYHLAPDDIHRHSDLGQTECPGDRFPFDAVAADLAHNAGAAR